MSSLKNALKSKQRIHKERSQLSSRGKVGFLEKKKDYRLRARDYQQKQEALKVLKKKALEKNPDEFYFHMINSHVEDGVHYEKEKEEETTEDQIKLMQTQDYRYVNFKRAVELKKIQKLKSGLHLISVEGKPPNQHKFFVDSVKEVKSFDVAKHLDTVPELLGRACNRPTTAALRTMKLQGTTDENSLKSIDVARERSYRELAQRMQREKQLNIIREKMEIKRHLLNKRDSAPRRIKPETKESAPVYKWRKERKR